MKQIGVAIIGTGWCGGIRAETCAAHPLVKSLDIAEVRPERLEEIARKSNARTAVSDYKKLPEKNDIEAVFISATPEDSHYPMARDCFAAGKHVFLEKPIALELSEMVGTEGAVMVDDSHRDVVLNTMVMELYIAADLSVESNLPVNLPLTWQKKIQSASVSR